MSDSLLREKARELSWTRREFLRAATGATAAAGLFGFSPLRALAAAPRRKMVVVTFGGGARDEETFAPEGQENIPRLINDLIPQATFFTQVVNRGILGHYVATTSLATGVYESFNNYAAVPPENPTIFEYYRKDLHRPPDDAWVIAPSNGFNRIGESGSKSYGAGMGAQVILPKHLLAALPDHHGVNYAHLLQDNYEAPLYAPALAGSQVHLDEVVNLLKLSTADFAAHAGNVASPDELSLYIAKHLMRQVAPSLLWITLHDIDIAHAGTYSLYIEGIQRSDRICAELWKTIQTEPEYKDRTNLFILPDFGRDSDTDPGGNGFQHHRTGDPLSRTTWMMVLGPGIRENTVVDSAVESIDLVPTLAHMLGCSPWKAAGKPITSLG